MNYFNIAKKIYTLFVYMFLTKIVKFPDFIFKIFIKRFHRCQLQFMRNAFTNNYNK